MECGRDEKGNKKKSEADIEDKQEKRERLMKKFDEDKLYDEASGPLGGGSFVVTGIFDDITRERLEEFIKKNGGRLVSAVSSKTDYLIVGY